MRKDRESSKQGAGASHYQLELVGAAGRPRSPRVVAAGGVVRRGAAREEQHKEGGGEGEERDAVVGRHGDGRRGCRRVLHGWASAFAVSRRMPDAKCRRRTKVSLRRRWAAERSLHHHSCHLVGCIDVDGVAGHGTLSNRPIR